MNYTNRNLVNFQDVCELASGVDDKDPIGYVLGYLAMNDIPMTQAVINLGTKMGIFSTGYRNGWSKKQ